MIFDQKIHSHHTVVGVHPLRMEEVGEAVANFSGEARRPFNVGVAGVNSFVVAHQLFEVVVVVEAGKAEVEAEGGTLAAK